MASIESMRVAMRDVYIVPESRLFDPLLCIFVPIELEFGSTDPKRCKQGRIFLQPIDHWLRLTPINKKVDLQVGIV